MEPDRGDAASPRTGSDDAGQAQTETSVARLRSLQPAPPNASGLYELSTPIRKRLMENVHNIWRSCCLSDPDMWGWWRACLGNCIDTIWVDVEHEVERRIRNSLTGMPPENTNDVDGPSADGSRLRHYWLRFRAFVLNHYLAHDLSFFGKLKDRYYLAMLLVTTVPVGGLRVFFFLFILTMLLFPGPPDEFQLVNYILVFKGTQFVTSGFAGLSSGAMRYFTCYTFFKEEFFQCVERHGPGAGVSYGHIFNYLGSVVLVWIAFSMLPRATKQAAVDKSANAEPPPKETWEKLRWLLYYDMICFAASLIVLVILALVTCAVFYWKHGTLQGVSSTGRDFHANLFWCNVFYSLLSLPFFVIKWLPGALAVLTHTTVTGYNSHGACVAFRFRALALAEGEEPAPAPAGPPAWTEGKVAVYVTRMLRLAERGRLARGGSYNGDVAFEDLVAGVFPRWTSLLTRRRLSREASRQARQSNGARSNRSPAASPSAPSVDARGGGGLRRRFQGRAESSERHPPMPDEREEPSGQQLEAEDQAPQEELPFRLLLGGTSSMVIGSLLVPADAMDQNAEGRTLFAIDVSPEEGRPWRVRRRYAEFRGLCNRLGKASNGYPGAPFPPKTLGAPTGARLEARRRALELWLRAVIRDPRSVEDEEWAAHVSEFLDPIELVNSFLDVSRADSFVAVAPPADTQPGVSSDDMGRAEQAHADPPTGSLGSASASVGTSPEQSAAPEDSQEPCPAHGAGEGEEGCEEAVEGSAREREGPGSD